MKYLSLAAAAMLLSTFLTVGYAKEVNEKEYTNSSHIFLILNQALNDVKEGSADVIGRKTSFEALKLAGFRVTKIVAIDMGEKVYLKLYFADLEGNSPSDAQGRDFSDTFGFESKSELWKSWIK